jgi:hypothetical protein
VPDLLTEITEIVTGLGMLGFDSIELALSARPQTMRNVTASHWDRLDVAASDGTHQTAFDTAWANGQAFLQSPDGLRGRVPIILEWKGAHQPPGFDLIPADLRVDHVYLVSCKYQSKILSNSSPSNLFDRRLADRAAGPGQDPWYAACAPDAYEYFYSCVRRHIGQWLLPASPHELTPTHLRRIRQECAVTWPARLTPLWAEFSLIVALATAERWLAQLPTPARREEMVWRLLRLSPAPYFILGSSDTGPLRLRIGTPWDWRQDFALQTLVIAAAAAAGQPRVDWTAQVIEKNAGTGREVSGHVEVRWAHGRFYTVEAKIYLDTPHSDVAGYFPLALP